MRLPQALQTDDDAAAISLLEEYYGGPLDDRRGYTGAAFDTWDPSGTRGASVDVFTADDVAAVTLLSVRVRGRAAHELLVRRADEMNALLADVPADLDLVDVAEPIDRDWSGSQLFHALRTLPGVGATTATKLIARKRPRLRPVWDSTAWSRPTSTLVSTSSRCASPFARTGGHFTTGSSACGQRPISTRR